MQQLFSDRLLHGADYNPEQWLHDPEILARDIEYMKATNSNVMSVGIFSWAKLEPQEGVFDFEWMDKVIDSLHKNGISIFLATPSGARPIWLAKKYPEVLRVAPNRQRNLFGARHNHCYTSPVYREKIGILNAKLADRYGNHPAVKLWHISNEYGGECHCDLCQEAFRGWLKDKYGTIEELNMQWWTTFWSHTYSDFSEIESPAPHGENAIHGMNLDWKRFVSDQTQDFMRHEIASVKPYTPDLPVTANFMYYFNGLNYFKFKNDVDIISWDNYPVWHKSDDLSIGLDTAMMHDLMRSIKKQPFLLMESTPSSTNWQSVSKLKKPGMHLLSSMQAIAHGSNSVQYFQWRKSRGSSEKLHGAVVSHNDRSDTRVFKEVAQLGELLAQLPQIAATNARAEVAIVYDWENKWAVEDSQGPRNKDMGYIEEVQAHYRAFAKKGISVDFVDMECDVDGYKVLVAPMLYMLRAGFEQKMRKFVEAGGTLITTYWTGVINENDLMFMGDTPHALTDVLGLVSEEIDGLYDHERNYGVVQQSLAAGALSGNYSCSMLCDLVHLDGAEAIMTYRDDFYAGRAVLTRHAFGQGEAYHIGSHFEDGFYDDFYSELAHKLELEAALPVQLPTPVYAVARENESTKYIFVHNFSNEAAPIPMLGEAYSLVARTRPELTKEQWTLAPYEVLILATPKK
ncbi:beta-galactosidase [Paenibacillus septentrionalis]|uniref:Beta-galactosidase n=2 Tax=Paenibacillus septentrionalis TaxID=429342 RepID=A0ABW1V8H3_9BACL